MLQQIHMWRLLVLALLSCVVLTIVAGELCGKLQLVMITHSQAIMFLV